MADPSDDIQVLGPEHDECVAAYNLLREELAKRTAELEQARLDLAYTEGERDSGDDTLDLIREAFGFKADEVEGWATLALREIRRIREQRAAPGPLHPEGSTEGHFEPDRSRARCQPESTPSPVPRVWKKGDPEPNDVEVVERSDGQRFIRHGTGWEHLDCSCCGGLVGWYVLWPIDHEDMVLTEVIQDGSNPDGGADGCDPSGDGTDKRGGLTNVT